MDVVSSEKQNDMPVRVRENPPYGRFSRTSRPVRYKSVNEYFPQEDKISHRNKTS